MATPAVIVDGGVKIRGKNPNYRGDRKVVEVSVKRRFQNAKSRPTGGLSP
jgi:hypothetical protein